MMRRFVLVTLVAAVIGAQAGPAAGAHLLIGVSGPSEVVVGEELEIQTVVRTQDDRPVEGATVVFYADSFFAGVSGELELGSTVTSSLGVATFSLVFSVRGVHRVRVEVEHGANVQEAALTIGVNNGPQIIESEAGIDIPGLGSWLVTLVIAVVWMIMLISAVWMVRVSRSGGSDDDAEGRAGRFGRRPRRRVNLALLATGVMVLFAVGLVTLLIRGPDTHHNFDPDGYSRSPVAYLDAAYVYPGPGLADDAGLTGVAVADGRTLFLKTGCAGCHGLDAQGAASARSPAFATRQWLETVVRTGLPGGMPAYADADLTDADLDLIQAFLLHARDLLADEAPPAADSTTTTTSTTVAGGPAADAPTFAEVMRILQPNCGACHGAAGGWSAADYESVVSSGDNGPAVVPGVVEASVLAQKLLGTQTFGSIMPPGGALDDADVQVIIDWIAGGAAP